MGKVFSLTGRVFDDNNKTERQNMNDTPTPKEKLSKILEEVEEEIERKGISFAYASLVDLAINLTDELTAAREEILKSCMRERLAHEDYKYQVNRADDAGFMLIEAREQRDRLVVALESLRQCISETRGKDATLALIESDQALQSKLERPSDGIRRH